MIRWFVSCLLVSFLLAPAWAGEITGVVSFGEQAVVARAGARQSLPERKRLSQKEAADLGYRSPLNFKDDLGGLPASAEVDERENVVVYLVGPKLPATPTKAYLRQIDKQFVPHVLPVVVGSEVRFTNEDRIIHSIICYKPRVKIHPHRRETGEKVEKAGPMELFCRIHPRMNAYIFVTENNFFATPSKGSFKLSGVPAGTYQLKAWHPRLSEVVKTVTVPEKGTVKMDLTFQGK